MSRYRHQLSSCSVQIESTLFSLQTYKTISIASTRITPGDSLKNIKKLTLSYRKSIKVLLDISQRVLSPEIKFIY